MTVWFIPYGLAGDPCEPPFMSGGGVAIHSAGPTEVLPIDLASEIIAP